MTTISLKGLDQQELLSLAESAGAQGDRAGMLACLKEASARPDARPASHYLLGIEYAELRLYDLAIDRLEAALALDPALAIARFQLGLLRLTGGDAPRAVAVLQPLDELGDADALRHFGIGVRALAADDFATALASLGHGIGLNTTNPALNADMQMLIARIEEVAAGATKAEEPDGRLMFLSAYRSNTSH